MINIQHIIEAAHAGGAVLKEAFGEVLTVKEKLTAADLQTNADLASEKAVLAVLKKHFPDYNILAEESGTEDNGSDYTLIIDPLDGTHNFANNIPMFTVTIGLIYKEEIVAGVTYHPIIDATYHAVKGEGAFLNGEKISVSTETDLARSTIGYSMNYTGDPSLWHDLTVNAETKRTVANWSPAYDLCLLAAGKIEAFALNGAEIYDFVAGKLIAKEAGAIIADFNGNEEVPDKHVPVILANNKTTLENLLVFAKKHI